jgi:small subunit ribosomal protein S13
MAYFLNTHIANRQKIKYALTQIYGIGLSQSQKICQNLGFSENLRVFELTKIQQLKLIRLVENSELVINSDLKRLLQTYKSRLISIHSCRGIRAKQGFPIRGQRTHTNAKTARKIKNS